MASKVSLILSDSDTCVTLERVFYAWAHSQKKPYFNFQKFISISSGDAPEDNDKKRKNRAW
jgi:hypothetical protein